MRKNKEETHTLKLSHSAANWQQSCLRIL